MTLQLSSAVYLPIVSKPACVKIVVFGLPFRSFTILCRFGHHLCIDFSFATPCAPSCKVNLCVYIYITVYIEVCECIIHCGLSDSLPKKKITYSIKNIGTLQSICTRTFRNLTEYLHRNPAQPHRLSTLKPSEILPGICSGTLRNLNKYLHRNPPEPQQVSSPERSGTLWNLARNLVLKLHRIAPELIWAKDPIAKLCCWGKNAFLIQTEASHHEKCSIETSGAKTSKSNSDH